MIKLYTKPGCVQCRATERAFEKHGLSYDTIDVSEGTPEALGALRHLQEEGYLTVPVVETGTDAWSGYRPDRIKALAG